MRGMQLPKVYEPSVYESDIYDLWEKSGAFVPEKRGGKENFAMVFPLPNANGNLHLGHGLTNAIYDVVIRYQRMKGNAALYLPGADHAGFETQVVYEKRLAAEGKSRFDFSREELYTQVYDFVEQNKHNFENQFRRLGASCDWSRYVFTLDEKIITRAYGTFKQLWDDGLVYRGERLVNFCTFHGTAFADIEVEHREVSSKLWYIRYPLVDGSGEVVVATTRPETMLGDTGVAVHPDDERYQAYIGKTVKLPLVGREIPIIADAFVELAFGTGAVKLTPAHDQNDYDAAERHALPKITVISHEGKITDEAPEKYRGLSVLKGREAVVRDLEAEGFLVKTEDFTHNVGHCYKCGTVIEPLLREQWFIDMQPLAKKAIKALQDDKIRFYPAGKRDQLITYLQGLRDWNISRQIAWGIPIPAFQNVNDRDDWIYDDRVDQEILEVNGKTYHRDPDVFDTWFSSSSWPYATLDFPDGSDYHQFYPTGLLDTGGEILYPWVSRMVMLGLYVTGDVPFREVYIHGYVMAEDGAKMSKSLGNVIDPLPVIDKYGSDALRMGLLAGRTPGVNRGYDSRKVEEARNFCNKLWNISRYTLERLGELTEDPAHEPKTTAEHWVLSRLQQATETMSEHLKEYRFSEAYDTLYHFVWDDVADWYIEASKNQEGGGVLAYVLENVLKLAHPFAPFVTETIWQVVPWTGTSILAVQPWPKTFAHNKKSTADFEEIKDIVTEVRALTRSLGLRKPHLYYTDVPFLTSNAELICRLAGLDGVIEVTHGNGLHLTSTPHACWLDVDSEIAAAHLEQLGAQISDASARIAHLHGRLNNESYTKHAPKEVVRETELQLSEAETALARLKTEQLRFADLRE